MTVTGVRVRWDRAIACSSVWKISERFGSEAVLVGFTTSVFSASYIGHELEVGRLTPTYLRFYHAMYQVLMLAMNLALVANNNTTEEPIHAANRPLDRH